MEEDRLSLFLRERVELELPEQRPPHFSPSLSSETSKQRGAVLLVFSEELAQFLVFPPVLHLVVPAVVIGTVSSGGGETAGLVTVGTQGGLVAIATGICRSGIHVWSAHTESERENT